MNTNDLAEKLATAIRKHRDQKGDDRCYLDDYELYAALPEGFTPPPYDTCIELENCKKYIASRQDPNVHYISPQREIEKLEAIIGQLRQMLKVVGGQHSGKEMDDADQDTINRLIEKNASTPIAPSAPVRLPPGLADADLQADLAKTQSLDYYNQWAREQFLNHYNQWIKTVDDWRKKCGITLQQAINTISENDTNNEGRKSLRQAEVDRYIEEFYKQSPKTMDNFAELNHAHSIHW